VEREALKHILPRLVFALGEGKPQVADILAEYLQSVVVAGGPSAAHFLYAAHKTQRNICNDEIPVNRQVGFLGRVVTLIHCCGSALVSMRIRIQLLSQCGSGSSFHLNADPDAGSQTNIDP
jgi:hypothetical protein